MAVVYDNTKIRLTNFGVANVRSKSEIVCAVGNTSLTKRKIAAIAVYLPPNLNAAACETAVDDLIECINKIKTKHCDPILMVGGDYNNKNITRLLTAFPELSPVEAGATRRGAALDEIYTNISQSVKEKCVLKPLVKFDGTPSDHDIVAATFKLPRTQKAVKSKFM